MAHEGLVGHFRAMARNNAWSNHRLYQACARLSGAELTAERTSFFPSIHLTLNHILEVDRLYLDRLQGRDVPVESDYENLEFAALTEAQHQEDWRLIVFCDALGPEDLAAEVRIRRLDGVWFNRVGDVLAHLFVHQIHHRGQVHAMLSGTPVAPPALDEFFLAEDAQRRREDLIALGLKRR